MFSKVSSAHQGWNDFINIAKYQYNLKYLFSILIYFNWFKPWYTTIQKFEVKVTVKIFIM